MYKLKLFIGIILLSYVSTLSATGNDCPNIAVVSKQGKYLLLDSNTLTITDVGDMRYLGIHDLDEFAQGSDIYFPVTHLDRYKDFDEKANKSGGAMAILPAFAGANNRSATLKFITSNGLGSFTVLRAPDRILNIETHKNKVAISIYDRLGNAVAQHTLEIAPLSSQSFCQKNGTIFYLGKQKIAQIRGQSIQYTELPKRLASQDNMLAAPMDGCHALLTNQQLSQGQSAIFRSVDISNGSVTGGATSRIDTKRLLLNEGKTLLVQQLRMEKMPDVPAYRAYPTAKFYAVNMLDGKIMEQAEFDHSYGMAEKAICDRSDTSLVIKDERAIHLLDIKTMKIKQSKSIPFKRFFVL